MYIFKNFHENNLSDFNNYSKDDFDSSEEFFKKKSDFSHSYQPSSNIISVSNSMELF